MYWKTLLLIILIACSVVFVKNNQHLREQFSSPLLVFKSAESKKKINYENENLHIKYTKSKPESQ